MTSREQDIKIIEETKMLVDLFLKTNASDIELSKKTGISSSTVGRRLTNKDYILKAFPTNGEILFEKIKLKRQENLLKGKALGGQTTLLNHVFTKDEERKVTGSTKLKLDVIFPKEENQNRFLVHISLYFHLHLDTLSLLFQIDEKELFDKLNKISPSSYKSFEYLFKMDDTNQDIARENFLNYYRELINAMRERNLEEKKRLINEVCDKKVLDFRNNHKPGDTILEEDIIALFNYQMKYALSNESIGYMFNIHNKNYAKRINAYLFDKPELKRSYEHVVDYNLYKYRQGYRRNG